MSENIPLEIQLEIILRIPDIKWVIQYRSVSKAWKSMIDSKEFVTGHTLRHIQQQPRHLLIRGQDYSQQVVRYLSIVDDDTFPHQKFSLSVPDFCKDARARLVGSSHGLFCLYDFNKNMGVIWNPSIRKTTVVPCEPCSRIDVLFGVCRNTLDPKIVKIPHHTTNANPSTGVEVFTLSLGAWRSPLTNTCLRKSIGLGNSRAVVDGFIYWDALDMIKVDGVHTYHNLIMSFDLTSEEFTELSLPVTHHEIMRCRGCTRSFEKLYYISPSDPSSISMTLGFRTSGVPIVELQNDQRVLPVTIAAYEPESKDITEIWSGGKDCSFYVYSYMETLLLFGQ